MARTHVGVSVGVVVGMTVGDPVVPAAEAARSLYPVVDPPWAQPEHPPSTLRVQSASMRARRVPRLFAPAGAKQIAEGVLERYSQGTRKVLERYSKGTRGVLERYSRGTHGILIGYSRVRRGYSRGTHLVLTGARPGERLGESVGAADGRSVGYAVAKPAQ